MLALTADGRTAYTGNMNRRDRVRARYPAASLRAGVPGGAAGWRALPSRLVGDQVWVGSNTAKTVSIIPTKSGVVADTIGGFGMPYRLAVTPDGLTAIITDPQRGAVRSRLPTWPPDSSGARL